MTNPLPTNLRSFLVKSFFPLLLLLLLSACATTRPANDIACNAPVNIPEGDLLLFGEMHGSVETPELVGRVACEQAKHGPAALGLEVPTEEQAAIDRYMDSDGSDEARGQLLAGRFWQKGRDGRSSAAMSGLLEQVRLWRLNGLPLSVFAFDSDNGGGRDKALAASIRNFRTQHPDLPIIALMGNIHASGEPFEFSDRTVVTSGTLLQDMNPVSILVRYPAGTVWTCMGGSCEIHEIRRSSGSPVSPGFSEGSPRGGYAISFMLPSITASPPAVDQQ